MAVVIDPNRTISAGRVDIGAFRTYPKDYTPPNASASEYQSIPLDKIEDFVSESSAQCERRRPEADPIPHCAGSARQLILPAQGRALQVFAR